MSIKNFFNCILRLSINTPPKTHSTLNFTQELKLEY